MSKRIFFLGLLFILSKPSWAQEAERILGPVIKDFGPVFNVENPDFKTDTALIYKVVFDVHNSPEDPTKVNPMLNTLARFLNMHAGAGVPVEQLHIAGVVHNKATHDVLDNTGYKAKYGVDNPNLPLLVALEDAGVKVYICGQSISARGVNRAEIHESVDVGLSAMTIILSLQNDDYRLIKF